MIKRITLRQLLKHGAEILNRLADEGPSSPAPMPSAPPAEVVPLPAPVPPPAPRPRPLAAPPPPAPVPVLELDPDQEGDNPLSNGTFAESPSPPAPAPALVPGSTPSPEDTDSMDEESTESAEALVPATTAHDRRLSLNSLHPSIRKYFIVWAGALLCINRKALDKALRAPSFYSWAHEPSDTTKVLVMNNPPWHVTTPESMMGHISRALGITPEEARKWALTVMSLGWAVSKGPAYAQYDEKSQRRSNVTPTLHLYNYTEGGVVPPLLSGMISSDIEVRNGPTWLMLGRRMDGFYAPMQNAIQLKKQDSVEEHKVVAYQSGRAPSNIVILLTK